MVQSRDVDTVVFRRTMGRFLTGVTVVATVDADGRWWGMTANSFTSVSLDPPLVSVCIAKGSGSYAAFAHATSFGVSILSDGQQDVARLFATPLQDKFGHVESETHLPGAPLVAGAAGTMSCTVHSRVPAGDHLVLIGRVHQCAVGTGRPLGYSEGRFFVLDDDLLTVRPDGGRSVLVGWLLECSGRVALQQVPETGRWTIPHGSLQAGQSMTEALDRTAETIFGRGIDSEFLYSTVDLNDAHTVHVYRARSDCVSIDKRGIALFAEADIPWDEMAHDTIAPILRRYFRERVSDRFGIYLNLGTGRIAHIDRETAWTQQP